MVNLHLTVMQVKFIICFDCESYDRTETRVYSKLSAKQLQTNIQQNGNPKLCESPHYADAPPSVINGGNSLVFQSYLNSALVAYLAKHRSRELSCFVDFESGLSLRLQHVVDQRYLTLSSTQGQVVVERVEWILFLGSTQQHVTGLMTYLLSLTPTWQLDQQACRTGRVSYPDVPQCGVIGPRRYDILDACFAFVEFSFVPLEPERRKCV